MMGTIAQAYVSLSCCQWCHCKRLSGMDVSLDHANVGGAHLLPTCNISFALLIQHHGCHTRHCKTCVVAAGAALKYIRDVLDEAQMPEDRAAAFRGAVLGSIGELAKSDAFQAAALVLERFPEEHLGVVQSLQSQPELQYKYLQGATQVHHVTLILPSSCLVQGCLLGITAIATCNLAHPAVMANPQTHCCAMAATGCANGCIWLQAVAQTSCSSQVSCYYTNPQDCCVAFCLASEAYSVHSGKVNLDRGSHA